MKKKGMVYNVTKIQETLGGKNIRVEYYKDGIKRVPRMFETLSDAMYWITEVNLVAHCALDAQININLN